MDVKVFCTKNSLLAKYVDTRDEVSCMKEAVVEMFFRGLKCEMMM